MAVECLKDAKAVLSLAHPKEIEKESNIQIESIVEELLNFGIDAIEVYHSSHDKNDVKRFQSLARKYQVLESGGSDYHDPYRKDRNIGCVTKEKEKIKTLSIVESLRRKND